MHLRPEHGYLGVSPPVRVGAPCGINRSQSRSRGPVRRQDDDMDVESGWDLPPGLDEFLLARIAEDSRMAADAAAASGRENWSVEGVSSDGERGTAEHIARYDPARIRAECVAKRRTVLACREARPDLTFLGARPEGMADFPLTPRDQHQFAALTLALMALVYAEHPDYRPEWRP